ncbi:MAG: GTP-binding protein LepA [Pricia sp.]
MTTYIARFTAKHRNVKVEQHSIFIWQQESGEVDKTLLTNKIKRESSIHFYRLVDGDNQTISLEDISVVVNKALPFSG